jgi:hypothetical protein
MALRKATSSFSVLIVDFLPNLISREEQPLQNFESYLSILFVLTNCMVHGLEKFIVKISDPYVEGSLPCFRKARCIVN